MAAVTGDSLATDPAVKAAERLAYTQSKCSECTDPAAMHPLLFNTWICASASGKADYGSRYIELVEAFGDNGTMMNICSPSLYASELLALGNNLRQALDAKAAAKE